MFHRIGERRLLSELYMRFVGQVGDIIMSYGMRGRNEQVDRGTPLGKLVVLSTAIDEEAVCCVRDQICPEDVATFKDQFGLKDKRILLQVVRITQIKRTDVLIRAFRVLCQRRSDVVLVLVGGGPLEAAVRRQAKELGLSDRVLFQGPIYDERRLGLWYKSADIFVMATCIGLSIHHAMCYGVPVITDDNPLTQASEFEVLQTTVNGLTYRSGDSDDFADKVEILLDNEQLRRQLGLNAMNRVLNDFTLEKKVQNFSCAIDRLASLSRRHRCLQSAVTSLANTTRR